MSHTLPSRLTVAAIVASMASLGLTGAADAATTHSHAKKHAKRHARAHGRSASASSTTGTPSANRQNPNETPLTGDALAKATASALAAVPGGTVVRAETQDQNDPAGGVYEVHMTKSDGSDVTVLEDAGFQVITVQQGRGGRPGGGGCHGGDGPAAGGDASGAGPGASTPATAG